MNLVKRPSGIKTLVKANALSLLISLGSILISCSHESTEITAEIIHDASEGNDFRGVNIGDPPSKVSSTEMATSVYSMPDELIYRIGAGRKDSTWYEINYGFADNGLNNIELSVFLWSQSKALDLRNEFRALYSERYGECRIHDEFCSWSTITANGKDAVIYLTDPITIKDPVTTTDKCKLVIQFREASR